ncbi:hypothetical protein CH063_13922 [Colletotrichum higginsianum]|uniref:Serine threonine protein kinase n=1 Tax=Colletotrichum higginsianum (strain IMI 349063) TaxID=759273 RepID=H1VWF6_COLHI|nr:Serine threonine protein kinase [Colletotrichum higginsianum IMI 349063]OBR15064.1 Serine threonine protein kinase [Colletotrichum higginsianum IMI 349063]CCF44568.1 hypothetical protein CH063_13922 [Colletotrichum higginsianum]
MAEEREVIIIERYCPPGVKSIIAAGGSSFIGEVDDYTVFKYPLRAGDELTLNRLDTERQLLDVVGPHERIIQLKGFSETGLYLERAVNGSVAQHLESANPPPMQRRLSWCREAVEAVAWVHTKGVFHCDINPRNLLLDSDFHVKLADFQGQQLSPDGSGTVLLDGCSSESTRFFCPREDEFNGDVRTELFALGCTIYHIIMGHPVYPDIVDGEDGWHEKVQSRFRDKKFPSDLPICSEIAWKCWLGEYGSADELLLDMVAVEPACTEA